MNCLFVIISLLFSCSFRPVSFLCVLLVILFLYWHSARKLSVNTFLRPADGRYSFLESSLGKGFGIKGLFFVLCLVTSLLFMCIMVFSSRNHKYTLILYYIFVKIELLHSYFVTFLYDVYIWVLSKVKWNAKTFKLTISKLLRMQIKLILPRL